MIDGLIINQFACTMHLKCGNGMLLVAVHLLTSFDADNGGLVTLQIIKTTLYVIIISIYIYVCIILVGK